ncbi:MAG: nitroreductase family protein [Defluviitaleaceae bacterium]|nr:nitroreductase family protein [Defluviitaleaceae bacterium]
MEVYEAIYGRRSIRKYQDTKVEKETLMKLAQAAIAAPNGSNIQPWDFVFVTDSERIARLCEILENVHIEYFGKAGRKILEGERFEKAVSMYARMANVPAFVLVCKNIRNEHLNEAYGQWTTAWAHHSIAAAMENLILAAVAEGLGTCWLGTPSWQGDKIKELLGIPENVEIVAMSPIGVPDESPKARPRIPVEEVTHFNRW